MSWFVAHGAWFGSWFACLALVVRPGYGAFDMGIDVHIDIDLDVEFGMDIDEGGAE